MLQLALTVSIYLLIVIPAEMCIRDRPQRFGDEPRPVRAPQHTGVPSGKNQKAEDRKSVV